jgi:serine/threonine-protein kinase
VVYEATHAVIGRTVALKVLHERFLERPEVGARLMNEARLASSIRNAHIVDIFDFGETPDGRTFVAMELLEGESLAQVIRRDAPLPELRTFQIAQQAADALGAAHERGILHRDVKPENVFLLPVDGADFVKVLDFGISKTMRVSEGDPAPRLTQTGMLLGTPLYMSPEQARGDDHVDHRIDIYALGVILYECLTGEVPFRGSNYLGIISDVINRQPTPPRELRPDLGISPSAERVVMKAMAKDRDERYRSMAELAADARKVLAGQTVEVPVHAPPPATARRSLVAWGAATVVVAALVATVALVASRPSDSPIAPAAAASVASPAVVRATPPPVETKPALPPPPAIVIVKVNSVPSGAFILNGARKLGVTPQNIELARSDQLVHLTFSKPGFTDGTTDVLPQIDGESINIELHPAKRAAPHHRPLSTKRTVDPAPVEKNPYGAQQKPHR